MPHKQVSHKTFFVIWWGPKGASCTMLTSAHTKSFLILFIIWVFWVINYFFKRFKCFFKRLPILSKSSHEPHSIFIWSKHCVHKFWGRSWAGCKFWMIISIHSIWINPIYISQTLNVFCIVSLNEIPYKKALIFGLDKTIMTFCGTSCSATGWTYRCIHVSY